MFLNLIEKLVDGLFAAIPRVKPSSHLAKNALLIAHRGAHDVKQGIIENTHQAFHRAKELGCWGIECDVQCTADGVLVVHHDPDLLRLWQRNAVIADLSYNELKRLAPAIPTLEEVVREYGNSLHLFIELKIAVNQQALLKALGTCEPIKDYHLLTLKPDFFTSLDQLPKEGLLLVAVHNNVTQLCDLSIEKKYGGVLGNYLLLTKKQCQRLEQARQIFGVGFVNSKNSLYRELNRGVHWLFTNDAQCISHNLRGLI